MSALIVLGTRPEIVKLGPVARELRARGCDYALLHTGQHFDADMSGSFLDTFDLEVDVQLQLGNRPRGVQIGQMIEAITTVLAESPADVVVVQGDTNSALAGAIAANAADCPIIHVEAGLRSFDRRMPEEHNRVLIDAIADVCCAPTPTAAANLRAAGVDESRIHITGNTVMDAIATIAAETPAAALIDDLQLIRHGFVLATIHRPENTDEPARLANIARALTSSTLPVVLPLHPRTRHALTQADDLMALLESGADGAAIHLIDPLDYTSFLHLLAQSAFVISDSGGIQEEVTATHTPLILVRDSTERPEVMGTFADRVSGRDGDRLAQLVGRRIADHAVRRRELADLDSPYAGPGGRHPSAHVADHVEALLSK